MEFGRILPGWCAEHCWGLRSEDDTARFPWACKCSHVVLCQLDCIHQSIWLVALDSAHLMTLSGYFGSSLSQCFQDSRSIWAKVNGQSPSSNTGEQNCWLCLCADTPVWVQLFWQLDNPAGSHLSGSRLPAGPLQLEESGCESLTNSSASRMERWCSQTYPGASWGVILVRDLDHWHTSGIGWKARWFFMTAQSAVCLCVISGEHLFAVAGWGVFNAAALALCHVMMFFKLLPGFNSSVTMSVVCHSEDIVDPG